jgi:hypothetical protein
MRAGRLFAWLVFVSGLLLGTLEPDRPADAPPRLPDGSLVLSADFHVHAFPGDGALPVAELRREAARRGLDVLTITNHNQTLAWRLFRALSPPAGAPLVLPGEEITAPRYHLAAAGISRTIAWRPSARESIEDVHAQGGVAIAAHPVRESSGYDDEAVSVLDGTEVTHPLVAESERGRRELLAFHERARRLAPRVAAIGSSDFHMVAPIGLCRTDVVARAFTAEAVLQAVREGRTVAYDPWGRPYGDPQLVRLVARARRAGSRPGAARPGAWPRAAASAAWLGLLALVVLGRAGR